MKTLTRRQLLKRSITFAVSLIVIDLGFDYKGARAKSVFDYNSKEFQFVINQLDMQGHADHDISTCTVKKVYYEEVLEALNNGQSESEILQSYVDEYGQAALRTPAAKGSDLIAWVAPAFGFLFGAFVVGFGIKKLTNKNAESCSIPIEEKEITETEREIIEITFEEERRKHF
ncbi:cytochrome c-type biogenesis protein CcmH [Bacillus sp. FJAT-29790]|uniref:cytochrome c-type biogenesis protein CcmH n=1 Tax=Bacillus sp. FJAT-29790 TaxID=1895002 RepID=UPI001C24745D|nr:cytochrome c-type biogenesis protein CcmH [Bacillus sp. FJAT-29790]MBU8879824.1 cytochrome c-type biogenesis protein CcmH [Bacillus sp. FJAT-29790]